MCIFWKNRSQISQSSFSVRMYVCMDVCMYVVTRLQPHSRNVQTWNFVRMFKMNRFCVVFFKFLISRLISPLTRKMGFSVGTHLKAEKWPKLINFFLICWNHVWLDRYCKSAKSENYDVIKFWSKNSKKIKIVIES